MAFTSNDIAGVLRGRCLTIECDCPKFLGLTEAPSHTTSLPWTFCQYCAHPPSGHNTLQGKIVLNSHQLSYLLFIED